MKLIPQLLSELVNVDYDRRMALAGCVQQEALMRFARAHGFRSFTAVVLPENMWTAVVRSPPQAASNRVQLNASVRTRSAVRAVSSRP